MCSASTDSYFYSADRNQSLKTAIAVSDIVHCCGGAACELISQKTLHDGKCFWLKRGIVAIFNVLPTCNHDDSCNAD